MIRAVLDTNVLVSAFLRSTPTTAPGAILDAWLLHDVFRLVLSQHILMELARTLAKPYFAARIRVEDIDLFLDTLRRRALITPITIQVRGVAAHPEDDLVLATAVSAGAEYLVTGDSELQGLGSYQDVAIVSPRTFLVGLSSDEADRE